MENKVLITLSVPYLESNYDIFIPVNKRVHTVIDLLKKSLFELSEGDFDMNKDYQLYNYNNGTKYDINLLIRDTDIRNNTRIIII